MCCRHLPGAFALHGTFGERHTCQRAFGKVVPAPHLVLHLDVKLTNYTCRCAEQFRGAAQPASDLYGLGGTLLYLLTGARPSAWVHPWTGMRLLDLHATQRCSPP